MTTLASLKHKKKFSNEFDEVELFINDDLEFNVRLKYSGMDDYLLYRYKNSHEARYDFTKFCLFILS